MSSFHKEGLFALLIFYNVFLDDCREKKIIRIVKLVSKRLLRRCKIQKKKKLQKS